MIMWTVLTWLLVPVLSTVFGVEGASLGYALVGVSSVVVFYLVRQRVNFSLMYSLVKPALAAFAMAMVLFIAMRLVPWNYLGLLLMVLLSGATYALAIYLLVGRAAVDDVKKVLAVFGKK
ncbi:MAG: hypothetical protein ACD_52C00184G0001 [uncultured bacterium]|nr:MAG: hypothetical protein ACD_52C00184G0001 [uncultured bacterium]